MIRTGNSIEGDLDIHPALADQDNRAEGRTQRSVIEDADLSKLEMLLLLEVKRVDVPRAVRESSTPL